MRIKEPVSIAGRCLGASLGLAALLAGGCDKWPEAATSHLVTDLVEAFPAAEAYREVPAILFGAPEARRHLVRGFSRGETDARGRPFAWSLGEESVLRFFLVRPRGLAVRLRCRPVALPEGRRQEVEVFLNGVPLPPLVLEPGGREYSLRLPVEALKAGLNRLRFRYRFTASPAAAGGRDPRELAVAWEWLRFDALTGTADPAAGSLSLPAGSRVDYFLELPAGAMLRIDGLEDSDGPDAGGEDRLGIFLVRDGEGGAGNREARLASLAPGGPFELPLGGEGGLARLRFVVEGGLVLRRPAVYAPDSGEAEEAGEAGETLGKPSGSGRDRPSVILYVADTLRADRLGCYGAERPLSPRIDTFAADAVLFEDAVAQSSWTKAATASLMTGLWPGSHGVTGVEDRLPAALPRLPGLLREAGYRTGAVVANAYVSEPFGFADGFERFTFLPSGQGESGEGEADVPAAQVHAEALEWLDARGEVVKERAPFFLYVHTIDPHHPYAPPEPFRSRFAPGIEDPRTGSAEQVDALVAGREPVTDELVRDLRALYDAEVAALDHEFGLFLDALAARGLYEETLIVFVSDHGETFAEHGAWKHGLDLYFPVLQVPFIVRLPGGAGAGRRIAEPVQQADLLPTLLDALGSESPGALEGRSLLPLMTNASPTEAGRTRPVFSHLDYFSRREASVILGEWKLIRPLASPFGEGLELYHRPSDPREEQNLAAERPVRAGYLASLLRARLRDSRRSAERADLGEETRARLRALGYL